MRPKLNIWDLAQSTTFVGTLHCSSQYTIPREKHGGGSTIATMVIACIATLMWVKTKNINVTMVQSSLDLSLIETLWQDLKIAVQQQFLSKLSQFEQFC